jgi:hypothetical protein
MNGDVTVKRSGSPKTARLASVHDGDAEGDITNIAPSRAQVASSETADNSGEIAPSIDVGRATAKRAAITTTQWSVRCRPDLVVSA